jgi:hypothetical protein
MSEAVNAEDHAVLRTLRAILERRAIPLGPRHRSVDEETAELGRAIEALADQRDQLSQELKLAQEVAAIPSAAISS